MAGDFKSKKIAAPEQPAGLTISSYKIAEYVNDMVSRNNLKGYKRIFEQIKVLVKSVMHVLCEKKFTIDFPLWNSINKIKVPKGASDTTITFPVQKYEYERWVLIFRALIPSVPYPFNANRIEYPLNNSTSIDLLSRSSSSELSDYSNENSDGNQLSQEHHEEWYETAVYAYQNLLLTSSSKKREIIDAAFQEANSNARNRNDRNKAHETRSKAINDLKKSTYDWVNRIGHIVKSFGYMRVKALPERDVIKYADLMLMNGVLNNNFTWSGLIEPEWEQLADANTAYPREMYFEAVRYYRNKECISNAKAKEQRLYDTIARIIIAYYEHHYMRRDSGLLHEFDIQELVLEYLDETTPTQSKQIRTLINRITDDRYARVLNELKTYKDDIVKSMLVDNVYGEPQQLCIVRMMKEFDISDQVISAIRTHPSKSYESYHNTVAWSILYNIVPFSVTEDDSIFTPKSAMEIYTALLNGTKINPQLVKDNMDTIKDITTKLSEKATSYAKFRLSDAFVVANNVLINL
jgi:hypothetical protein